MGEYTKKATLHCPEVVQKIYTKKTLSPYVQDFEKHFGKINTIYKLNHYLLKYWYTENWDREGKEHYVPVTFEEYEKIFSLLGMSVEYKESYLIPFLREKWIHDFGLTDDEAACLKSTGIIIAKKIAS